MDLRRPEPADVLDAHECLDGIALRTPLLRSDELDARAGGKVFVKCESLQRSGAFKFRGAYNCLSRLDRQAYPGGVVAYSTGNHGQAVATVGRMLGLPTTIVMPYDAPAVKIAKARAQGAQVVLYDRHAERREEIAARIASAKPVAIIPPGDNPLVIAGQGTAAGEALQALSGTTVDVVLVPCGGGGLAAGSCLAVEAFRQKLKFGQRSRSLSTIPNALSPPGSARKTRSSTARSAMRCWRRRPLSFLSQSIASGCRACWSPMTRRCWRP